MVSLLIVSDIHASDQNIDTDGAVSWYSTLPEYDNAQRNPFFSIPALLEAESLKVDAIICPGDLADCANPTAQGVVWGALQRLRTAVDAKRVFATVGNHDIDSRLKHSTFDPKTTLQSLSPSFPGFSEQECDFYWSRNFLIFAENDVRYLVLNSCAFHGVHSGEKEVTHKEYLNGRVSDRTIEAISKALGDDTYKMNVLVVHHHIYKNEDISDADYSEMTGGQHLVTALESQTDAPWLIVHGHQHYPKLFYAAGSSDSPVILSAGSMSRKLSGALAQRGLNQIYHVELPISDFDKVGCHPCGLVRSWHWTDRLGWKRTNFSQQDVAGIPYGSGFGCRKSTAVWAEEISNEIAKIGTKHLSWDDLIARLPALRYVLPHTLRGIKTKLKESHGLSILNNDDGYPEQIGRP